jgi:hypothetical protein
MASYALRENLSLPCKQVARQRALFARQRRCTSGPRPLRRPVYGHEARAVDDQVRPSVLYTDEAGKAQRLGVFKANVAFIESVNASNKKF